jgi:hypothetical protein
VSDILDKLDAETIVRALDMLGAALADHGHTWTNEQRFLYEAAVSIAATAAQP